jgi:septum formation protein
MELARQKVKDGIIITADTIVVYNKEIIGKPKSKNGAIRILQKLNGNTHQVYTGFCLLNARTNKIIIDYEKTSVTFNRLTNSQIKKYVASGSPMDKAGAYGIQDEYGAVFVKKINGCYNNVVGLPLAKIYTDLRRIV